MKNRQEIYPDWKFPVSVQGQNRYNIRTPIHQQGEQTFSKQARTDGKIKSFAANTNAVPIGHIEQKNLGSLHKMCNLPTKLNFYKQIRPSHILGSGDMAFKVINTFKNHYINPFDPFLEKKTLFHLSPGACLPAEVTDYLLLLHETGKDLCKKFLQSRILTTIKRFHNKITRNNIKMLLTKKTGSFRT